MGDLSCAGADKNEVAGARNLQVSLSEAQTPGAFLDEPLKVVLAQAQTALARYDLHVSGLRYTIAPEQKAPGLGLWIVFDLESHNPLFFGSEYSNQRRVEILGQLYSNLSGAVQPIAGEMPFWLDAFVSLKQPYLNVAQSPQKLKDEPYGLVDVHQDNGVEFLTIDQALQKGELKPGSLLEEYCRRYGGSHVLKHGGHYISPDPITLEMLEVFVQTRQIKSFLEIGSGVGLSAAVADKHRLTDFGFVDLNQGVVDFINQSHPGRAVQSDALKYNFDRKWDLVQIGIPYELSPWFLEKKGADLGRHADAVVIQSACLNFFEFEHAWVLGDERVKAWPWFDPAQTISKYYPCVIDASHGFQSCIIASKTPLDDLLAAMNGAGFRGHAYRRVSVE